MEQQSGASGAAQAARTILPGEPFEPPAASAVPAPRDEAPQFATPEAPAFTPAAPPMAPPAWGTQLYQPMPAPDVAPIYQPGPAPQAEPQPVGGDFDSLHDFASLPVAPQFGAPAPATEAFSPGVYPPPPAEAPTFAPAPPAAAFDAAPPAGFPPPVFAPAPEDALPPLPPAQDDEGLFAEPEKKAKKDRKPVDKRLLAGALVVVLAGGGYFGYTQLSKKSSTDNATAPVAPVTAPVAKYNFPSNVAGFKLQPAASSATLRANALADAKKWNPALAKTMSFASYSAGSPSIVAISFHPPASQSVTDFASLVKYTMTPDTGSVTTGVHLAVPGAAGGQMTCGGERGKSVASWCVWRGTSSIGVVQITGSSSTGITEIVTRELRAYAEH